MTRNIEFVVGRIIITITLLTITITKKNTHCRIREKFTMFYMWTKNKANRTKKKIKKE